MSYRKFKADYLFDGYKQLDDSHVLVTDEDGTVREIVDHTEAGEGVEMLKGLLSPGFINCHCHLELSHLRGLIPMKTGLVDFVFSIVSQRKADYEEILASIESAEEEMLAGGIVAVGDICNTSDTLAQKSAGRISYYNFIELAGWLPGQAQSRFNSGKALYEQFAKMTGNTAHLSINPHAPYSVSSGLWDLLKTDFIHKTITIHNQETAAEDVFFISAAGALTSMYTMMKIDNTHFSATGTRSLPYYLHQLGAAKNILLVHNTFTAKEDLVLATAFSRNLFFCLCPNANLYIEDHLPDIPAMMQLGGNMVMGTDSLASNCQLSVLEEIKTIKKKFPAIETESLLQWATSNGARALQYENKLGDFKKGKKPGIVLIDFKGKDPIDNESSCRRIL
jgi:cytosine/adenosine deaminase-related metal-dependent hydrolase